MIKYLIIFFFIQIVSSQSTRSRVCDVNTETGSEQCSSFITTSTIEHQSIEIRNIKIQVEEAKKQTAVYDIKDCADVQKHGFDASGVYEIYTGYFSEQNVTSVFCDMDTDGGGWTVFQRRHDGSVDFRKNWHDFKHGFGDVSGEHWLGNKFLYGLTKTRNYKLSVYLEDWEGKWRYAEYSFFLVLSERDNYTLEIGSYRGDTGDSLSYHDGMMFSTLDRDNDRSSRSCVEHTDYGGFWMNECMKVGVNNHYSESSSGHGYNVYDRIRWDSWHGTDYSLKSTRMMIRPTD